MRRAGRELSLCVFLSSTELCRFGRHIGYNLSLFVHFHHAVCVCWRAEFDGVCVYSTLLYSV